MTAGERKDHLAPCLGCAPQIAELEQLLADRSAGLEKAHAEIERLGKIRPDVVMATELEAVAEDRDRLAARVRELEARLSAAPGGSGGTGSGNGARPPGNTASGESCRRCGQPGAPVLVVLPDGTEDTAYACDPCLATARRKQPEVTFTRPEPVTSEAELADLYEFDYDELSS